MLITLAMSAHATDYLAEDNEYLLNYFKNSGIPTQVYLNCEQDFITPQSDLKLQFTFGGNLSWNNIRRKAYNCWYVFTFGAFDIHYKLYYKHSSDNKFTLATEGTVQYIDANIAEHEAPEVNYERTISNFSNIPFSFPISWKLPHGAKEGAYSFQLDIAVSPIKEEPTQTYTVGKHFENGANNIFCKYESALRYLTDNGGITHRASTQKNISGAYAQIIYNNSNKSIIQSSASGNPLNEEGYRLVYNHPQAEFCVELRTDNVPADTIINNRKLVAFSNFIAGVGENFDIPSAKDINNEYTQCITDKEPINSSNLRYIEYVRYSKNQAINQFLYNKYNNNEYTGNIYNDTNKYGLVHFRNILLQTHNQEGTLFNENAVNNLTDFEKLNNKWFTRNYHVRDLQYIKLPKTTLTDHTVFKVWNKINYRATGIIDVFSGVGCIYYGPFGEYTQYFCSKTETYPTSFFSANCLLFKLVPQVYFAPLSEAEKTTQVVCTNEQNEDIIHLAGKSIVCNNISPTVYSPLYFWQISENGITWKNLEDNHPHKVNGLEMGDLANSKDLYLKSSIVKNKTLYFRQICVLKSFASTEESNLYNYPITINGKTNYYISIVSPDKYTYKGIPTLDPAYMELKEDCWNDTTYLCHDAMLPAQKINFAYTQPLESNMLHDLQYKVYQVMPDGNKTMVSKQNNYLIPTEFTDSLVYECVVSLCNDSIAKTVKIVRYKPLTIHTHQLQSSVAMGKIDSINQYIQLWCLKGVHPTLAVKEPNNQEHYFIRAANANAAESTLWQPFTNAMEQSTVLSYSSNNDMPRFYLKKTNQQGCESDSIIIDIKFIEPIKGNSIAFKHTELDTVFVPSGQGNPHIVGSYPIVGGYGPVSAEDSITYTYQWMRKSSNGLWEPVVINSRLYAQVTENGTKIVNSGTKYVSLPDETIKDIQENWELARFVYSRKNGDVATQLVSMSNSLWIMSTPLLDAAHAQVYNADCPNDKVSVVIHEPEELLTEHTQYIWKASNSKLQLSTVSTYYNKTQNKCIIKEADKDFTLSVYRYNTQTGVRSNTIKIPVSVASFNAGFSILYNNYKYSLDEELVLAPGSKIQLINESVTAEENRNLWVLQVQNNFMGDNRTHEGTTSQQVNPYCYLYNLGQNKIKLTTVSAKGCTGTVWAENIQVKGVTGRAMASYFAPDDVLYQDGSFALQQVYPTLLCADDNYQVYIKTNKERYTVSLCNSMGQPITPTTSASGNSSYSLASVASGIYLLNVDNIYYKLIKP